jgi:hypothetical protein
VSFAFIASSVHLGHEFGFDPGARFVFVGFANGEHGVDFVDKDYGGCTVFGHGEESSDQLFSFSYPFACEGGAGNAEECGSAFVGYGFGD